VGRCTVGSALWRIAGGQLHATVIVKGCFQFVHDEAMTTTDPTQLRRRDEHVDGNPLCSLLGAAETCPRIPAVGVHLVGHAYSPGGGTRGIVRLVMRRDDRPLIDKSILAYGPRDSAGQLQPFHRLPLSYEYALGGVGFPENPIGVGAGESTDSKPQLVNPNSSRKVAAFGPIPSNFPARRNLRGQLRPKRIEKGIADYPGDFLWEYFQAAPADQRLSSLRGDEWIELHGMHPEHELIRSRLPSPRAACLLLGHAEVDAPESVPLVADMVHIEPDRLRCSVVWRGCFPLASELAATRLLIAGGVELPGTPIRWPTTTAEVAALASAVVDPETLAGAHADDLQMTARRSDPFAAGSAAVVIHPEMPTSFPQTPPPAPARARVQPPPPPRRTTATPRTMSPLAAAPPTSAPSQAIPAQAVPAQATPAAATPAPAPASPVVASRAQAPSASAPAIPTPLSATPVTPEVIEQADRTLIDGHAGEAERWDETSPRADTAQHAAEDGNFSDTTPDETSGAAPPATPSDAGAPFPLARPRKD